MIETDAFLSPALLCPEALDDMDDREPVAAMDDIDDLDDLGDIPDIDALTEDFTESLALAGAGTGTGSTAAEREKLFRELVGQHGKRLYHFVLRRIGSVFDAEELTQQAFVEAAKAYETYRGEAKLSTWLYGIAMNLVRNHLNRCPERRYKFESADESMFDGAGHESESLESTVGRKQQFKLLWQELGDLPAEMREVLMLVGVKEMSYEEASVMLSIPVGTVRSRLSRARSTLRSKLSDCGWDISE
ncbi:RNA polymerase sigma factor [Paraburkholderia bonniea]|uniref:RNA polymerase sigma factor n=1 Tax=Paraburkholderia bonniea TaxID=2152891 RepID=UPI001FE88569|nr:RNA polymerase sigma factor [Paraburkholderia bonniea]WJF91422.1 RNA polymerase sigma factor [Paraburkholderia bonniea]WJF94739.1 RNA polymerase sigma factor [Paraburkholderia bonniea]